MITAKRISRIKRRFDRGGVYLNYVTFIISMATMLKVFNITAWYWYAIGIVAVLIFRYVAGYIDDRKGILKNEQEQYTAKIPQINEILEILKKK